MKNQLLSATDFVENVKNTVYIYRKLWRENTTALIHAPQSVDKTAKALEIAAEASASGRKIVYINAANTLHDHADAVRRISGLSIFNPSYESADDTSDYADIVIGAIEEIVTTTDIRTVIVDSVSRIAALSFGRNSSAAYVMKRLTVLQIRLGISILVIANDTTRAADRALLNLADSEILMLQSDESDPSDMSARSDKSDQPDQPDQPDRSATRHPLSRRDRRILRRQQQSLKSRKK